MPQKTLFDLGLVSADNPVVTGLSVDSRDVQDGFLFAALPGVNAHGAEFIQYALRQGATAILTDVDGAKIAENWIDTFSPTVVVVQNPREALCRAAALWFGAQPQTAVAVTGTNGKTSVSTFCRQIWNVLGRSAVNLGTTGAEGSWSTPLSHTTPEPITLHRTLAGAFDAGVTHVSMEASSHGLDQYRLDGVSLCVAGFTNFTQDHLDYHKTFDAYFDAKMGLFRRVLKHGGIAVVNLDDPKGKIVKDIAIQAGHKVLSVGRDIHSDLRIIAQRFDAFGQEMRFEFEGIPYQIHLPLVGGFQGENVLLAAGMVIAAGEHPKDVFAALNQIRSVRGRMQLAGTRKNGASVFVDYAHTPDAVATALKSLRPHVMGRLVVVLGAGGDRDPTKRSLMGQAAQNFADIVFVTDDNPRTEDADVIRKMVMDGAPEATEVGDRAEAILRAVDSLGAGDTLLIAGKGHETGQTIGNDILPFDDVEQASISVQALDGGLA